MEFFAEAQSERLDKFLAARVKKFSRAEWQRFIKDASVKINGHFVTKTAFALRPRDRVTILEEKIMSRGDAFVVAPEPDISLDIVYEDGDIAVVNKPAGMLVHPTFTRRHHTLANALVARYPDITGVGEDPLRPGIVHRLDKDTSGLIVVAKNQAAFLFVKEQFLKRTVAKTYLALVEGVPKEREGVIAYDIRPSKQHRLKKVAVKRAEAAKRSTRAAKTLYKVRETFGDKFALLEVSPQTGRTHQIRVHLAAIGTPVAGDTFYGAHKEVAGRLGVKRQLLHALGIRLVAPGGTLLELRADPPADFRDALARAAEPRYPAQNFA